MEVGDLRIYRKDLLLFRRIVQVFVGRLHPSADPWNFIRRHAFNQIVIEQKLVYGFVTLLDEFVEETVCPILFSGLKVVILQLLV